MAMSLIICIVLVKSYKMRLTQNGLLCILWYKRYDIVLSFMQQHAAMTDCAVGNDGKLLDTSQITWYHDADDDTPILATPLPVSTKLVHHTPSPKIAGAHCTCHILHPSTKA